MTESKSLGMDRDSVYVRFMTGHESGGFRTGLTKYGGAILDFDAMVERVAKALEAADAEKLEEVFTPGSQMEGESLEQFSRRYWATQARAALEAALTATEGPHDA